MRITSYDWPGGREAMLRFGADDGPTLIAALPLFEEANRTRASLVAVLRCLAERGIASALPDLPGMGESLIPTEAATLADWRTAFAAAARTLPGPVHAIAWRGGTLVDGAAQVASRWHLSPISGAATMRELRRVRSASGGALYAGNRLSDEMIAQLESTAPPTPVGAESYTPARTGPPTPVRTELVEVLPFLAPTGRSAVPHRTVRPATDPRPADAHLPARPLWRAAEPGTDAAFEAALADDITAWIHACAA